MHHHHPPNWQSHFQTPDKKLQKNTAKITKNFVKRLQDRYLEKNCTGINQNPGKKKAFQDQQRLLPLHAPLGALFSSQKQKAVGQRRREGRRRRTPPPVVSSAAVAGVSRRRRYGRRWWRREERQRREEETVFCLGQDSDSRTPSDLDRTYVRVGLIRIHKWQLIVRFLYLVGDAISIFCNKIRCHFNNLRLNWISTLWMSLTII